MDPSPIPPSRKISLEYSIFKLQVRLVKIEGGFTFLEGGGGVHGTCNTRLYMIWFDLKNKC